MKKLFFLVFALVGFMSQAQEFDFNCEPAVVQTYADGVEFTLSLEAAGGTQHTVYLINSEDNFDGVIIIDNFPVPHEEGSFSIAGLSGLLRIELIVAGVVEIFTINTETGEVLFVNSSRDETFYQFNGVNFVITETVITNGEEYANGNSTLTFVINDGIWTVTYRVDGAQVGPSIQGNTKEEALASLVAELAHSEDEDADDDEADSEG